MPQQPKGPTLSWGCKHNIAGWSREVIVPLNAALEWPHLKYCVESWAPQCKKVIKLQTVSRGGQPMVKGLKSKWSLGLFSLEKRKLTSSQSSASSEDAIEEEMLISFPW